MFGAGCTHSGHVNPEWNRNPECGLLMRSFYQIAATHQSHYCQTAQKYFNLKNQIRMLDLISCISSPAELNQKLLKSKHHRCM